MLMDKLSIQHPQTKFYYKVRSFSFFASLSLYEPTATFIFPQQVDAPTGTRPGSPFEVFLPPPGNAIHLSLSLSYHFSNRLSCNKDGNFPNFLNLSSRRFLTDLVNVKKNPNPTTTTTVQEEESTASSVFSCLGSFLGIMTFPIALGIFVLVAMGAGTRTQFRTFVVVDL